MYAGGQQAKVCWPLFLCLSNGRCNEAIAHFARTTVFSQKHAIVTPRTTVFLKNERLSTPERVAATM